MTFKIFKNSKFQILTKNIPPIRPYMYEFEVLLIFNQKLTKKKKEEVYF